MEPQGTFVILKRSRAASWGGGLMLASGERSDRPSLSIEVKTLTEKEAYEIRRDPDFELAESVPMRLIEPAQTEGQVAPSAKWYAGRSKRDSSVTWGVRAVGADRSRFSGKGIAVAILDTGIDANHDAFKDVRITTRNFTNERIGVDTNGHGTHCAATFFGQDVSGIRIGVAPRIEHAYIAKVLDKKGAGSTRTIVEGLRWANGIGAAIASISIGMDFPGLVRQLGLDGWPTEPAVSRALELYRENLRLFDALAEELAAGHPGTLVVAAAGNESRRGGREYWRLARQPPSAARGFIAVSALQRARRRPLECELAPFSNSSRDAAGPGFGVVSAKLKGGLTTMHGTSMAAPHVAGVAALWAEEIVDRNGAVSVEGVAARVRGRAIPVATADGADAGTGLVQAPD